MCTWCGFHVALLSSLGADGSACNSKGGFGCVLSRAGHWVPTHPRGQLLHVPDPPRDDVPPPPTRPASYAAVTNTPPVLLAKADHVYVRVGGQKKPLVVPCDGPYPGGLQGGQDVHHPGGPNIGSGTSGTDPRNNNLERSRNSPDQKVLTSQHKYIVTKRKGSYILGQYIWIRSC